VNSPPRVAFLTDTFHEVNGVALTSRQFRDYAQSHQLPFLCVYGGEHTQTEQNGSVTELQLKRGPLAFHLDKGLRHDPALWRFKNQLTNAILNFQADLIHITSPGDVGEMGAVLAHQLKIPLVISWHTNFHEFGARRLDRLLHWMPQQLRDPVCGASERHILSACLKFYSMGRVLFAPNDELVAMLAKRTLRPAFLMKRGIDIHLYSPVKRTVHDGIFRIGYVGRITPEKNVRLLVDVQKGLFARGHHDVQFLVVGDGSEREWLARNLHGAELPGVLRGEALAEAYANMDLFVFPSKTDTFGNVVLEALASSTPALVTDQGGPKFIIENGITGYVAPTTEAFVTRASELMLDREQHQRMCTAARQQAMKASWDAVFHQVYEGYSYALALPATVV
jgi:phosphatidylinositol alpha 1,6-mannosyltransferase